MATLVLTLMGTICFVGEKKRWNTSLFLQTKKTLREVMLQFGEINALH